MPNAPPEPPEQAPPAGDEAPPLGPDGQPISVPDPGAAAVATGSPDRRGALGPTCARHDSAADPLDLIDKVLDGMRDQGFVVGGRERRTNIRGTACAVRVAGGDPAFLQYQLERTSDDGFVIIVVPTGSREVELIVRPVLDGEDRGVLWAGNEHVRVTGKYLGGDDGVRLRKIVDIGPGNIPPAAIGAALQQLGYRSVFEADGRGQLNIVVSPGQSIRRVRVHGHLPLSKREVQRELSVASRPGALAHGRCLPPSRLRKDDNPLVCEPGDGACEQWQRDEVTRMQRYLFDKGYLRGTARVAFACGRSRDEVDLHVYLDKGPAYRVPLSKVKIVGNMPDADKRWIRRAFWPRVKATPFPARITHERIEDSKDRTERQYAEPRDSLIRQTAVPQLTLPYPEIRIETSYDDLKPEDVPKASDLPLTVRVDLGRGVKTSFIGNRSYTDQRLRAQLQLFSRREAPSDQTAVREAANLRAYYQSKGFLLTEVQGRYDEFGSTAPGSLTFVVKEGPVVKIRRIEDKVTRGVPPGILERIERDFSDERTLRGGGTFTEAGVVDHLTALLTKYADNGYLCASAGVRVAFWPEGLDKPGEHANVDVETILRRDPAATWAERDFNPEGLAALRKLKRADLYVRITVEPGPRVFTSRRPETIRYLDIPIPSDRDVSNLPTHELGEWGATRMLRGTPLRRAGDDRPGNVALTPSLDRDVEQALVDNYRNQGYPVADAELSWLYNDPQSGEVKAVPNARRLADPDIGMCQAFPSGTAVEVGTELSVYEGRRGVFGDTVVRGNFKTRSWVLRRQYAHRPGRLYVREEAERTTGNIDGLGVAESTTLTPYPVGCDLDDAKDEQCVVHQVLEIREAKDISMDIGGGIGFATLDPFYLFLHPKFPNVFGTGWDLDTLGHLGIPQVSQNVPASVPILGDCDGQRCYEQSARGTLTRPRIFGSPIGLDIGGQFQLRETPARGRITSAIGTIGLTYSPIRSTTRNLNLGFGYLIQKANISQDVVKPAYTPDADNVLASVVNRRDAIVSDRTGALYASINYTNVDNPFNPDDGIIADAQLRFASPYFGGLDWFLRGDLSFQHFIPIPRTAGRLNFRYTLRYGHAIPLPHLPGGTGSASVPEIWRYWGGGTYDLGIRGILPETMLVDIEEVDLGDGVTRLHYTAQGGHIRALGTVALKVVSRKDFIGGKLAHSLFFDLGILTQSWSQVQLSRDFRRSVGINFLQWDIKFVTLALGYAVLLPNAIAPGNVKPIDDRNGRFIFDVGITF
jgi:outer membrane protein assembly factor BamA